MSSIGLIRRNLAAQLIVALLVAILGTVLISKLTTFSVVRAASLIAMCGTIGIFVLNLPHVQRFSMDNQKLDSSNESPIKSFDDRKEQAIEKLSKRVKLRENSQGKVEITRDTGKIQDPDRRAMLYVFGVWLEYEKGIRQSPILTREEIRENTDLSGGAIDVFLDKMEHYIVRHYPEDRSERVEMDESEMKFEMNVDEIEKVTEYLLAERSAPN